MESLYRRPLPGELIPFSSSAGRQLFAEALAQGTLEGYFGVAEQFHTQADPAFCGLGSLVVALNALGIDPGRLWKGPWRWFSEELLDCCIPLEQVRLGGITLDELACLARCNGAAASVWRADVASVAELREALSQSSRSAGSPVVIASYSRSVLGQTGEGHYSPVAGFHVPADLALVLDVARFKYPPHWVPVARLYDAMRAVDAATGKSRGWVELVRAETPRNLAFVFTNNDGGWRRIARFLCDELPAHIRNGLHDAPRRVVSTVLAHAAPLAAGIELRKAADPSHQSAVEKVLGELRTTAAYSVVANEQSALPPELGTLLLLLVPEATWLLLPPSVADEMSKLTDSAAVPSALASEIVVLRQQLAELTRC